MTKFDLDTLKSLCKSMFDHWRKAAKTDTNIGSNGDGSSLEVPEWQIFGRVDSAFIHWAMESITANPKQLIPIQKHIHTATCT